MPGRLNITSDWERLDVGTTEERACFAAVGILWNDVYLTEGRDSFVKIVRKAPYLSAYHLAEWLTWNWWRLRWEPRSSRSDWAFAHRLSTIGGGYVWPNITIFSDGERTALLARPTGDRPSTPYRYICDTAAIVASNDFEVVLDQFVETVRGKLRAEGIGNTNLDTLWADLTAERADIALSQRRKFEALLGEEPDEADEQTLRSLVEDAKALSESAMNEIAADHIEGREILTADVIKQNAVENGFDASPRDQFHLRPGTGLPRARDVAAWRLGAAAAHATREQARLGSDPISDRKLSEMAGLTNGALGHSVKGPRIAYALDLDFNSSRIVFRSKWKEGRRFELARILGDRIVSTGAGPFFPATRANTYRQKMQRSFAAELLSPFEAVDDLLNGDYSEEAQRDAAEYFQVSEMTIRTLLVNHGRIDREELEADFEMAAA